MIFGPQRSGCCKEELGFYELSETGIEREREWSGAAQTQIRIRITDIRHVEGQPYIHQFQIVLARNFIPNVASVSRPKVLFLRAFGSMHGGLETAATAGTPSFFLEWGSTSGGSLS